MPDETAGQSPGNSGTGHPAVGLRSREDHTGGTKVALLGAMIFDMISIHTPVRRSRNVVRKAGVARDKRLPGRY